MGCRNISWQRLIKNTALNPQSSFPVWRLIPQTLTPAGSVNLVILLIQWSQIMKRAGGELSRTRGTAARNPASGGGVLGLTALPPGRAPRAAAAACRVKPCLRAPGVPLHGSLRGAIDPAKVKRDITQTLAGRGSLSAGRYVSELKALKGRGGSYFKVNSKCHFTSQQPPRKVLQLWTRINLLAPLCRLPVSTKACVIGPSQSQPLSLLLLFGGSSRVKLLLEMEITCHPLSSSGDINITEMCTDNPSRCSFPAKNACAHAALLPGEGSRRGTATS